MHVCLVYSRAKCTSAEERSYVIGVYTTRTLALEAARAAGEEWTIREHGLNYPDEGETIWDDHADLDSAKWGQSYALYWRGGFPV